MSSPRLKIIDSLAESNAPQIGIAAASRNIVDAVIEVANETERCIILAADRNQVECKALGGGRVEGWTTQGFAGYVRERDYGKFVALERSFASVWTPTTPADMSQNEAICAAKVSLSADVDAGFDIIHIATGLDRDGKRQFIDREIALQGELYRHAASEAQQLNCQVSFDVGTPQSGSEQATLSRFLQFLHRTSYDCTQQGLPQPLFVTANTGTYVDEFKNLGLLDRPASGDAWDPKTSVLGESADLCSFSGFALRARNCDFLSKQALRMIYPLGIQAADFGQELAVNESKTFIKLCDATGARDVREDFLDAAYDTQAWQTFGLCSDDSTEFDKALSCAHILFSTPVYEGLKARLEARCGAAGMQLDQIIKEAHKTRILSLIREMGVAVQPHALMPV